MRQKYLFVRAVGVCLLLMFPAVVSFAQNDDFTEGSLRIIDQSGAEKGLCPLKKTDVKAGISGSLARVTVTQTFENPYDKAIEAVYAFPLPNDSAVDDMTIKIGERTIRSKIMESETARKAYEKAKSEGKVAALLDQQRPNLFTQRVSNITPNAEIRVIISYVETLPYTDDTYQFMFPMKVGERYIPSTVTPEDAARISPRATTRPAENVSLEVDLDAGVIIQNLSSNTHEIETQQFSGSRFVVRLKNEGEIANRDFVLTYKTAGQKIGDAVLTHNDGSGGYFSLILQPPDKIFPADAAPKEIVFVLDTSGSMSGFPIEKAKEAMRLSLENLNPNDTFNLITFAGETAILFEKPVAATPENLKLAKDFLSSKTSGGGTEMMKAIKAALAPTDSTDHIRIVCFMTDGYVGNEFEIINEVKNHPQARVFGFGIGDSVNRFLLDEISRQGRGEVEYVNLSDDGSAAARRFFERVRNPLLTDISIDWNGLAVADVYPEKIPDLFDAKPVTIAGRYTGGASGTIILRGKLQGQVFQREIAVELPETNEQNDVLKSLWARRKVSDLMARDLSGLQKGEFDQELKNQIISLSLEYRILTQFTSFVAVDDRIVTAPDQTPEIEGLRTSLVAVTDSADTKIDTNITRTYLDKPVTKGNSVQGLLPTAQNVGPPNENNSDQKPGLAVVSGQRATSNYFTVDSASANLGVSADETSIARNAGATPLLTAAGGTNAIAPLDALDEVTVKTLSFDVSNQPTAGGQINFVTRGGNNDWHGSLSETFGNEKLNAKDFFADRRALKRAPSRLNQFGGTFGGFFRPDKAWFFVNYDGLRLRQAGFAVAEVPTVPTRNNASALIRPVFDAFPLPNGAATANGFAEFAATYANPAAHDIFGFRFDAQPTNLLRFYARYNLTGSKSAVRADEGFSINTVRKNTTGSQLFYTSFTFTPTSKWVLNGSFNFGRNRLSQKFSLDNFGGADISGLNRSGSFAKYDFSGRNAALAFGDRIETDLEQFQFAGAATAVYGNHRIDFGADFRRLSLEIGAIPTERNLLFAGAVQSSGGIARRIQEISRPLLQNPQINNFSLYFNDEWRVNPNFTLNFGVRWSVSPAPQNAQNPFTLSSLNQPFVLSSTSKKLWPTDFGNFAPRVGFAYSMFDDRTTITGGIGLFYDAGNVLATDVFAESAPFLSNRISRNTLFTDPANNEISPVAVFSPKLKTPRTWIASAGIEQDLGRNQRLSVTYVGAFAGEQFLTRTFQTEDPNNTFIRLTTNDGRASFHSGVLAFSSRISYKFFADLDYTFSRSIDNFPLDSIRRALLADPAADRASSDFDVRHKFTGRISFDIPAFSGGKLAKALTENWTIYSLIYARTAMPVTVFYSRETPLGFQYRRPDLIPDRPLYITAGDVRNLNPAAFSIPNDDRQGNLGRNSLRGYPFFQLDLGINRKFKLAENVGLDLSAQFINLFNNRNPADQTGNAAALATRFTDGTLLANPLFGQSFATFGGNSFTPFYLNGGPRTVQLSAKLSF